MAASVGIKGYGTLIGYAATAEASPANVAEVLNLAPPKTSVKDVDLTNLASPDSHEEWTPGTFAVSEPTLSLNFAKAVHAALRALVGVFKYWRITYMDGSTEKFYAYINEFGNEQVERDGSIKASCKMKVSGKVTFTAGA